jgi:type IX secretion system PorP/SprF family membrane protein
MKKIIPLILVFQLGVLSCLKAQIDPHFSQIYAYPLWLNPALTGAFDGAVRFTANFKDQWTGITNGYQTGAVSADFKATEKVSLGLNLINQVAGSANFNYFAAYGTFGYAVPFSADGSKKLHFGLQVGFIDRSFDPSLLQFDGQYNPLIGYDPNITSGESFLTTDAFIFDSGAGIYYDDASADDKVKLFGGASIYHINGAPDPFAAPGTKTVLPVRFNIHGGLKITASESLDITPNIIYIRQQQNQVRAVDIYAALKSTDGNSLIIGAMYRLDDAVVAEFGYHINNTMIGISYDINTSPLNTVTNGHGGLELSLNYIFGSRSANSSSSTPGF